MAAEHEVVVRPEVRVIVEQGPTSWGAHVPSVPGCFAIAATREEVQRKIESALTFHLRHLHSEAVQSAADEAAGATETARR